MNSTIQKLLLFVQGPEQTPLIWEKLIHQVQQHPPLESFAECRTYQTDTPSNELSAAVDGLADWYFSQKAAHLNKEIILVGHGLGGVLIQQFIIRHLERGLSRAFFNLRQLILFAVPHHGYRAVPRASRMMYRLKGNPLLDRLKEWDDELPRIGSRMLEYVIEPVSFNSYYRPLSVQCFTGEDDRVVTTESAQGNWSSCRSLKGNHLTLLEPDSLTDERFVCFCDCLLNPPPHKGIYFVEKLETLITVEPFSEGVYKALYGQNRRTVETDNYGTIRRTIRFAPENACLEPYSLRYSIENEEGFIKATTAGGINITSAKNQQLYDAHGLEFYYEFIPHPGRDYSLLIELYKGFDHGYRDSHFHLGDGSIRFETLLVILDLSAYLKQRYLVSQEPTLMMHPEDTHRCSDRFAERSVERIVPPISVGEGRWEWEIKDIGGGVIDLFWDLEAN